MADTDVCWNMGKEAATTGQESCFAEAAARNQGPEGDVDILRRQLGECMCCLPGSPSPATTSSWQPWSNAVFIHRHASVAMRALVPCRAATVGGCTLLDGALRRTDTDTLCAPAWHSMNGEHSARASLCPRSVLRPSDMGSLCGGEGTADTQGTVHDATPSKSTGGINRAMGQDERHPNRHLHGGPSRTGMGQWST